MGDAKPDHDSELIRAAGGLVWSDSPRGKVLAVVHRKRHDDYEWTLPKGRLEKNESWMDAARREVREETGCRVRVGRFAGSIGYTVEGRPKLVRFWNMSVVGEPSGELDSEVEELAWLTVEEACARIRYPLEASLIESSQLAGASPEPGFLRRWWRSHSYHRLAQTLPPYREELTNLIYNAERPAESDEKAVALPLASDGAAHETLIAKTASTDAAQPGTDHILWSDGSTSP